MRILVFTTDMIPLDGYPTSGTALRTFGFIQGLRAHGHEVIVSPPRDAISGFMKNFKQSEATADLKSLVDELSRLCFDPFTQADVLAEVNPDIILCGHWPAMMLRTKPSVPLIIDLAGPHLLERHFQGAPDHKGATLAKLRAIATADYFIVSGPRQRLYFLSFLLRAGVQHPEKRIFTIRMPLPPTPPMRNQSEFYSNNDYPKFIFAGVFLPWQDPSWGLKNLANTLNQKQQGHLTLIGGQHPNYTIAQGSYDTLFSDLESNPRVTRYPMLPYEQFTNHLSESHVALDLMAWNLERQLAVTIRTTSYLWSGVPVIYNNYADFGDLIKSYDAGWCLAPGDENALNVALDEIYSSPNIVAQKSANATKLALEEFAWDKSVTPLLELIEKPETSPLRETDIIIGRKESADFHIFQDNKLIQYFLCRIDGLSRVEFLIATHDRVITQPLTIRLSKVEVPSYYPNRFRPNYNDLCKFEKTLVFEKQIQIAALINNEWVGVDFRAISQSDANIYELVVASPQTTYEHSISPWVMKANPYPMLGLSYNSSLLSHMSLCLRTVCVPLIQNNAQNEQANLKAACS